MERYFYAYVAIAVVIGLAAGFLIGHYEPFPWMRPL